MSATSGDYGVTIPSAPTVNANPGSVPNPGVGTMSTSNTSLAKTFCVEAPVAFSVQTFGSLTRMESRVSMGTSVNVICHRSAPAAAYNLPLFVLAQASPLECLHQRLQRRRRRRFLLRRDRRTERHSGNGDRDKTCVLMGHNVSNLPRPGGRFNGDGG